MRIVRENWFIWIFVDGKSRIAKSGKLRLELPGLKFLILDGENARGITVRNLINGEINVTKSCDIC